MTNDFLKAATARSSEVIEINGAKALVRALSLGEHEALVAAYKGKETGELTKAIIAACLFDVKGVDRILDGPEGVKTFNTEAFTLASGAVARVHGWTAAGN